MSKLVKSLGALGAIILVFLAGMAWRSWGDARAEAPVKTPSLYFRVMGGASGRSLAAEPTSISGPIAIKDVKAEGALSPAAVRKTLTADLANLANGCREAAREAVPLPTQITLVFKVGPDGKLISEPLGKPPLAPQKFESLMAGAIRDLQFPAFQGTPVQVEVTLALAG